MCGAMLFIISLAYTPGRTMRTLVGVRLKSQHTSNSQVGSCPPKTPILNQLGIASGFDVYLKRVHERAGAL
jgi:hypothetical protein